MKILYTITGLTLGGAETITVNLASRMQKLGNDVKIMCLSGEVQVKVPDEIETVNLQMSKTPVGFIKALLKAKKIAGEFKPDVVHANMFHAIVFSRFLCVFVKIPRLVCTEHSNNFHGKLRQFLEHCTDFLSDVNTNVSEKATEDFIKKKLFSKKKSLAVYNGIDLNKFYPDCNLPLRKQFNISETDFVFINVSRMMPAKDHRNLLDAFKIIHEKFPDAKLICVGSGELLAETENYAESLGLESSVIFTGAKINVQDFYNASDCFVLSSAWEGFGIVLAEAMACGLPVVSTDCGGTREVVQNDKWLVPPKNSELLAAKMIEIMKMPEQKRRSLGKENRMLAQKFSLDEAASQWLEIYKNGKTR